MNDALWLDASVAAGSQVSRFDSGSQPDRAAVAEAVCPPQDEARGGNQSDQGPGMDSRLSPDSWLQEQTERHLKGLCAFCGLPLRECWCCEDEPVEYRPVSDGSDEVGVA